MWTREPDAEKLVTFDYYVGDPQIRRRSWLFRRDSPAWTAEPNPAHRAIASCRDAWVVTQNIDGLHQRAGTPTDRVLELHGTMRDTVCLDCGDRTPIDVAKHAGARIIIVNNGPTPYDVQADAIVRTPIPEAIPALCSAEGWLAPR